MKNDRPIVGEIVGIKGSDYVVRSVRTVECRTGSRTTMSLVLVDKRKRGG